MAIPFDTLDYSEEAIKVGFTKEQANFQAKRMSQLIDNTLATKNDLKTLEMKIIMKVGAMMVVQTGLILTVVGFMTKHI